MSASQYAHTINEQRYTLLEQLVTKLLHVEQGDENFELARDFCVQRAWYHTFPAVNPRETEAFYADLVARLEADSQTTKASALSALTHKLLALKLVSATGVPDLNHNLLQLLASLSDQPISSSLDLSPDVLDLLFNPANRLLKDDQQQQQEQGEQAPLAGGTQHFQRLLRGAAAGRAAAADGGSMSDEYDPYGDNSSLSDWDEGEGKQQQQNWGQQPLSTDAEPPTSEEDELQQSQESHLQQQQTALTGGPYQPAATTAYASRQGVQQLPYGCVVPAPQQPLAKLQTLRQAHTGDTQAASVPPEQQQQLCLSEHFVAQQVLRVLQGLPALGFIIKDARDKLNKQQQQLGSCGTDSRSTSGSASGCSSSSNGTLSSEQFYDVDPRVSTPHMPSHALHALLQDAAAAGTRHRQMRALVQQLAYAGMVSNSLQVTPCLRALGAALQQQLDSLGCQLADLQRQLQQEHEQRRSSSRADSSRPQQQQGERGLLLRYFRREARPVVARLQLLHSTVFGILRQLSGPPAAVSAGFIDGLTAAVQAASADEAAGPQVVAGAAALLHLLLSSCVPLSRALAQWLWCAEDSVGALSTGCQQQAGVSVCSSDFFIVRKASRDVAAVHPSFWHKAYGFSTRSTPEAAAPAAAAAASSGAAAYSTAPGAALAGADVCCPAVLAPFVQSIMTAGKSMRLLDYMDQEDLKRSSLCSGNSSSSVSACTGADAVASGVAQQQQQQQQRAGALGPGNSGGALQRQPSTPRRRRPSSSGGRPSSSSTAAAGGGTGTAACQLSRQPSLSGRPGTRPAPIAAAVGTAAQPGKANSRKKWDVASQQPASPADASAAAAALYEVDRNAVSRSVGLQLAAAAAMAGQQLVENELPHEFIRSANYLLQQEQELQAQAHATMQQHKQYLQHCSGHSAPGNSSSSSSSTDLLLERLESVASALSRPHALAAAGAAAQGQQPSLRDALAAARKARAADAAVLGGSAAPRLQQAGQLPAEPSTAEAAEAPTASADSSGSAQQQQQQQDEASELQSPPAAPGTPGTPADRIPAASPPASPAAPAANAGTPDAHQDSGSNGAHSSSSSSGGLDVVPKLTVWKDQMEAKLSSAHQHLQCIAPWQQQQQQPACSAADDDTQQSPDARHTQQRGRKAAATSTHASSRNWLLQTADTKVPGHFTGSLAELWPLKPVQGLKELAASGASWLQGAAWPGCDLEWLLQHPPAHLPSVQQLLWSTLVQPVRTRVELVDRQLMSSLMGEWGMLQQLQGLTNAFLITSPSMVEWVEALFSVVETAKLCPPRSSRGSSGEAFTPSPAGKAVSRLGGGAGGAGWESPGVFVGSPGVAAGSAAGHALPVTVEDLDLCSLEALLQDCILSADPDEVLPDPRSLLITLNREPLVKLREQQDKQRKAFLAAGQQQPAAAGEAPKQPPAVGLMLCSKEWAGLELQHAGSWQLSLVYTHEQIKFFGQVWRVMLQLRWVRRRVGAQAVAHRISARVNDLTARDRLEAAQAAAAVAAKSSRARPSSAASFRQQQHVSGRQPGDAAGAVLEWLTGKEELLLLQEMTHFLSCWHSYVMDGIRVKAWGRLEEVLLSAKSLDQVHSATRAFLRDMYSLCGLTPPGASRRNNWRDSMRQRFETLLDQGLAAAAAAGRLYAARQKLKELQGLPGREDDVQAWWVELEDARRKLQQAGTLWKQGLGQLLKTWVMLKKNNMSHAFDELSELLDMNGYFRRLGVAASAAAFAT